MWHWTRLSPSGGDITFQPGQRYAVLASVSESYTLDDVMQAAGGKGFEITYAWETGQAPRSGDTYLPGLAPPRSGDRWVYAEGNFKGQAAWSLGVHEPWFVPMHVYTLDSVFLAEDVAGPAPTQEAAAFPWGWAVVGALALAGLGWVAWQERYRLLPAAA